MFRCFLRKYKKSSLQQNELFSQWFPCLLNKRRYLNFAERGAPVKQWRWLHVPRRVIDQVKQAVRSLVLLRYACYQGSTCSLSTRSSAWDLDLTKRWEDSSWGRLRA